ncbi:hypothetical protein LPJ62_002217, partial [Coemansia sp. RSA 2167]
GGYGNQGFPGDNYGGNQGGYQDQGYQNQGYQNQGYQAPGYGGNQGQSDKLDMANIDPSMFNENDSINDMVARILGDPSMATSLPDIEAYQGSRDLNAVDNFNMDEFEQEFGSVGAGDGQRGLFGFGGGNGKSKTSHQIIGGAAAWAAFNWYENWKVNTKGEKMKHGFIKKLLTAFAAAQAVKFAEQKSSGFQGGLSRDVAIQEATNYADHVADAKYQNHSVDYTVRGGEADNYDNYRPY